MEPLQYLLQLYAGLISVNILISATLWAVTRSVLHFYLLINWLMAFTLWVVQSQTTHEPPFFQISVFAVLSFFGQGALAQVVGLTAGYSPSKRWPLFAMAIFFGLTVVLNSLNVRTLWMGLPAIFGAGLPLMAASVAALTSRRQNTTFLAKCFATAGLIFAFFNLSYANSFEAPDQPLMGFSIAIILVFILSALAPAAIIEMISQEKAIAATEQRFKGSLIHSAKMTALGEMAGGIAHEINNPLSIILYLSEQLGDLTQDKEIDRIQVQKTTSNLHATAERIQKVVSGLRSFSRDGSRDPFQPVNIHEVIENTIALCQEKFKSRGVEIVYQKGHLTSPILGRFVEISQVLLNLLNNAFDAVQDQPRKWIRVTTDQGDHRIEIRVTDSGLGIPENDRSKIFQPFFTTKELGKGTGMGLSISSGIIQAHGGEILLEDGVSDTTFLIRLPQKHFSGET